MSNQNMIEEQLEVKIGARNLTEFDLKMLLPQYRQIENEVNHMRDNAKSYHMFLGNHNIENINLKKEYISNVNNVISILGGRGSGKSSVLLTIKHKLDLGYYDAPSDNKTDSQNKRDIIMPTILPETMESNSDLLGWILGGFRCIVDKIEEDIYSLNGQYDFLKKREGYFVNCRKNNENPLRQAYNKVLKQYRYTKPDYQKIILKQYENFMGYLDDSKNIMDPQNQLIVAFHEFIEEIVRVNRERKGENQEQEPMVFLFIDDADLSCERLEEVLNVIVRYLAHPNIVTFVAGDILLFKQVLLLNYLEHMKIINVLTPSGFSDNEGAEEILHSYNGLVEDNIKKILPPSLRFNLKAYEYDRRLDFKYDNNVTLKDLIEKCFEMDWNIPKVYGVIFDKYPRGLMNVYYELYVFYTMYIKKKSSMSSELLGNFLEKFIQVIIRSKVVYNQFEDDIMKCIYINKEKLSESWIDYIKADNIYFGKENKQKSERLLYIFTLLNFVENIINKIVWKQEEIRRKLHGEPQIYKALNNLIRNETFQLFPCLKDTNLELEYFHKLIHDVSYSSLMNIKYEKIIHESYLEYFKILNSESKLIEIVNKASRYDIGWVTMIFNIINMNRDQFEATLNGVMKNYFLELKEIYAPDFLEEFIEERIDEIRKSVKDRLSNKSNTISKILLDVINEQDKIDNKRYKTVDEVIMDYEICINELKMKFSIENEPIYFLSQKDVDAVKLVTNRISNEEILFRITKVIKEEQIKKKDYDVVLSLLQRLDEHASNALKERFHMAYQAIRDLQPIHNLAGNSLFFEKDDEIMAGEYGNQMREKYEKEIKDSVIYLLALEIKEHEKVDSRYFEAFQKLHNDMYQNCSMYKSFNDNKNK